MFVTFLFLISTLVQAEDAPRVLGPARAKPATIDEIQRLEDARSKRALYSEERSDLTSLYFLMGQCEKVVDVYSDRKDPFAPLDADDHAMLCACDGKCDLLKTKEKASFQERLYLLRQFIKSSTSLKDSTFAQAWSELKTEPEAQALMVQKLKKSSNAAERAQAQVMIQKLQALHVDPK